MENKEIQQKVFAIKTFYAQLVRYVGINAVGVIIWMLSGGGYFWPIWAMLLWGLSLAYEAYTLDLFKNHEKYKETLLSIAKKWEEEQIKKIKEEEKSSKNNNNESVEAKPAMAPNKTAQPNKKKSKK